MAIVVLIVVGVLVCVGVALAVRMALRGRAEASVPRCGNCGYNLTGAPSNRCPECGKLFVEAGVITGPPASAQSRTMLRVLLIALAAFTALAVLGTVWMMMQTRSVTVQRALMQTMLQQQPATTAPVGEERPASRPAPAP